jgi:hypothetical protein
MDPKNPDASAVVCERDENFCWHIGGVVYPRTIRFLEALNIAARQHDGDAAGGR